MAALQALTVEEARARRDRLAKMRALLFYHELKAKRVKAIKSKDYHRRLNRAARRKATKAGEAGDEGALQAAAEDAEFERAKVSSSYLTRTRGATFGIPLAVQML